MQSSEQSRAESREGKEQVLLKIQTQIQAKMGARAVYRVHRCIATESLKNSHWYAVEHGVCHSRVYASSTHNTRRQLGCGPLQQQLQCTEYCCTLPKFQVVAALPPVLASTIQPRSPRHSAVSCPPQGRQSTDTPSGSDSGKSLCMRSKFRDSRPRFPS